jgi:uncharacterized membrane protein YphA (DoxX/SURF4 family)
VSVATVRRSRFETAAPWISTVARLLLAGVFITAGVLKAANPQDSVATVRAYELLPGSLATLVGWGLPFAEIALGLLLAVGLFTRVVAVVTTVLLVVFLLGIASAAARGLSIDCGCFGGGGALPPGQAHYGREIVRDAGLLILAAWLVWRPTCLLCLDRWHREEIA